jgi:hypothetical protein
MAKFGRFELGKDKPTETYEGDYMEQANDYVRIFKGSQPDGSTSFEQPSRLVAAIRLKKGQRVLAIESEKQTVPDEPGIGDRRKRKFRD